ncbi:MAG TPA: DUF1801 domain-containing protein [Actinomycetota bacterium]|nr:DUF1801 domain-containing protein [Actinomycetota bacterium]
MGANPDVERWFEELDHPLKDLMLEVRAAILGADERIEESIKWKSPTFSYRGNIASIDPRTKAAVNVMFHQGAKLPGRHPMLEGGGETVRYLKIVDAANLRRKRKALRGALTAWVALVEGSSARA